MFIYLVDGLGWLGLAMLFRSRIGLGLSPGILLLLAVGLTGGVSCLGFGLCCGSARLLMTVLTVGICTPYLSQTKDSTYSPGKDTISPAESTETSTADRTTPPQSYSSL